MLPQRAVGRFEATLRLGFRGATRANIAQRHLTRSRLERRFLSVDTLANRELPLGNDTTYKQFRGFRLAHETFFHMVRKVRYYGIFGVSVGLREKMYSR